MAKSNTPKPTEPQTIIILFTKDGQNYRMRVARVHVHPGERDRIEVEGKTMLDESNWTALPDGSLKVPSPEWLIRRALWCDFTVTKLANNTLIIGLGEI